MGLSKADIVKLLSTLRHDNFWTGTPATHSAQHVATQP